ncbi:MAG: hypothetical protein U5K74_14400 [Gemmatimonadaceae bacterium]|nr:hypothetical protein [Gemmatimonadaceae bacterium]
MSLYVGARMYDREPRLIVPGEKIRDVTLTNSDYFAFILDTYHDRQNGFVFATTPAGVEYDGQVIREGEGGGCSPCGPESRPGRLARRREPQLGCELDRRDVAGLARLVRGVPHPVLDAPLQAAAATQTWGLNITRGIRRQNEEAVLVVHSASVQPLSPLAGR